MNVTGLNLAPIKFAFSGETDRIENDPFCDGALKLDWPEAIRPKVSLTVSGKIKPSTTLKKVVLKHKYI